MSQDTMDGSRLPLADLLLAVLVAVAIVSLAISFALDLLRFHEFVFFIAAPISFVGACFAYRRWTGLPSWPRVCLAGAITGAALPFLVLVPSSMGDGLAEFLVVLGGGVGGFALAGAAGACIARLALLAQTRFGLLAKIASIAVSTFTFGIALLHPDAQFEETCHTAIFENRDSVETIASFTVVTSMAEWRDIESEITQLAVEEGWEVRSDVRPDYDFPWFQISLCVEPGLVFKIDRKFDQENLDVRVLEPVGDQDCRDDFQEIEDRLAGSWRVRRD